MDDQQQAVAALSEAQNIIILSHVQPDGDCIGSMLALGLALQSMGKKVIMANNDPVPQYLSFLPSASQVQLAAQITDWPELVICVDCSDLERLGSGLAASVRGLNNIVNIDHHVSNNRYGTINWVEPDAAATGQLVATLIAALNVAWNHDLATLIYTAIATDTGSFQYGNTTGDVHRLAARLVEQGLDVARINQALYETKSLPSIRLLGRALENLQVSENGKVGWVVIPLHYLAELGAKDEHTEGIINYTRAIDSVEVGLLFRELSPGKIKVGFRSKQLVDVNQLAMFFGGGGHTRAAGCNINGDLSKTVERVIKKTCEVIEAAHGRHN
ncbi:MAG: bifunctional oligoribonuclease/PAP phosphatase NrnA [Peptococcaceae bacterium]|nr:bifunctional oligoribonuclease/PAP phosphatase NrnA [Peptococcaceae bacterium]